MLSSWHQRLTCLPDTCHCNSHSLQAEWSSPRQDERVLSPSEDPASLIVIDPKGTVTLGKPPPAKKFRKEGGRGGKKERRKDGRKEERKQGRKREGGKEGKREGRKGEGREGQ